MIYVVRVHQTMLQLDEVMMLGCFDDSAITQSKIKWSWWTPEPVYQVPRARKEFALVFHVGGSCLIPYHRYGTVTRSYPDLTERKKNENL